MKSTNLFVDSGLISLPLVRGLVLLLLGVKDVATLLALLGLNAGKVGVVNVLGDLDAGDINLGLGGDDEALIDSEGGSNESNVIYSHLKQLGLDAHGFMILELNP